MIEVDFATDALKHKGCDACGSHKDVVAIRVSNEEKTSESTVCLCRDCFTLLAVGMVMVVERRLYDDPTRADWAMKIAKAICEKSFAKEESGHDE
jgi:hypothetical protein